MSGYYSRDLYRGIADLSEKRAKATTRTCACGAALSTKGSPKMCGPCSSKLQSTKILERANKKNRAAARRRDAEREANGLPPIKRGRTKKILVERSGER